MAYIAKADLEEAISPQTLVQLCDDDGDGVADTAVVNALIRRACGRMDARIATKYAGPFPISQVPTPEQLREGAILYAVPMAFMRHPEYVRKYGDRDRGGMFKDADTYADGLANNILRIVGYDAEPDPANVGGGVYAGTSDDAPDGVGTGIWGSGFGDF